MKEIHNVSGIPENETIWQKAKRKATTALNWGKTHWKGIALGAVALGGGAYMLSRKGNDDGAAEPERITSGSVDYRQAIEEVFSGDGNVGPEDDEPEED